MFRKSLKLPSGAAGDTRTPMQKEVVKMCSFLKTHLRSQATYSTLPAVAPAKQVYLVVQDPLSRALGHGQELLTLARIVNSKGYTIG